MQMLNMIPIRMLPKSRKDIRDFFNWIIKESNKNKAEEWSSPTVSNKSTHFTIIIRFIILIRIQFVLIIQPSIAL